MDCAFTPSRCHIDLGALQRNFGRLGKAACLMPVIKSDAYGHGLLKVAKALDESGARFFAVGTVDEGVLLRKAGLKQDILPLMGCLDSRDWHLALGHGLVPLVKNFVDLETASSLARLDGQWHVALKFDTGMGRLGFTPEEVPSLLDWLRGNPQVLPGIAISHFACADMPEEASFTCGQRKIFDSICVALSGIYPDIRVSLDNSAAVLSKQHDDNRLGRPGLALYGGDPLANARTCPEDAGLEWVMSVSSPILHVRSLKKGDNVSYGRIFTAPRSMKIAVIGAGYATGFSRALSNRAHLLIHGIRARQIGRICMSMCMADITHIPQARVGDLAWIIGGPAEKGQRPVTVLEMAETLGTIPYEILCLVGSTNPRVYSRHHPAIDL